VMSEAKNAGGLGEIPPTSGTCAHSEICLQIFGWAATYTACDISEATEKTEIGNGVAVAF